MSSPRLRIVYSRFASDDISEILYVTGEAWGEVQRRRYRKQLRDSISRLSVMPSLGRPRDDLRPGVRSVPVGSHLLYYSHTDDVLYIRRLLHARQDASMIDWESLSGEPGEAI